MKALVVSNIDPDEDDVIFSNDHASWNVSRAQRDCAAGKHKLYLLDVAGAYDANKSCEVDEAKVERFMRMQDVLDEPLIGVLEGGACWLIDGQHRLRALQRLGVEDYACYIIEEADSKPYQVWFNGERQPPFELTSRGRDD